MESKLTFGKSSAEVLDKIKKPDYEISNLEKDLSDLSTASLYDFLIGAGFYNLFKIDGFELNGNEACIEPIVRISDKVSGENRYVKLEEDGVKEAIIKAIMDRIKNIPREEVLKMISGINFGENGEKLLENNTSSSESNGNKKILFTIIGTGISTLALVYGFNQFFDTSGNQDVVDNNVKNKFVKSDNTAEVNTSSDKKIIIFKKDKKGDNEIILEKNISKQDVKLSSQDDKFDDIIEKIKKEEGVVVDNLKVKEADIPSDNNSKSKFKKVVANKNEEKVEVKKIEVEANPYKIISNSIKKGDEKVTDSIYENMTDSEKLNFLFEKDNIDEISLGKKLVSKSEYDEIKKYAITEIKKFSSAELRKKIRAKDLSRFDDYYNIMRKCFPGETDQDSFVKYFKFISGSNAYEGTNIVFDKLGPNTMDAISKKK